MSPTSRGKQHGGRIDVETEPGVFTSSLLRCRGRPGGAGHSEQIDVYAVVDDERCRSPVPSAIRRDIRSGRFAMEFARRHPQHWSAPPMSGSVAHLICPTSTYQASGWEMLRGCAERRRAVIMITAMAAETRKKAIERGAVGLLTKPIDFALLRHKIDHGLRRTACATIPSSMTSPDHRAGPAEFRRQIRDGTVGICVRPWRNQRCSRSGIIRMST